MWDAVGHTVSRLKRIRYGTVKLTRDIKRGHHTKIAPKQLEKLVNSVGLGEEFASQLYSAKGATTQTTRKGGSRSGFKPKQGNRKPKSSPRRRGP